MTEKEFVDKVCLVFQKTFTVEREVWSECKTSRIDILLTLNNLYVFGIECKIPDKKRGEELGRFVSQASRYSKLSFPTPKGYKIIPIFICPAISYRYFILNEYKMNYHGENWHKDRHNEFHEHHSFNGFIGSAFGIGEVRSIGNGNYNFIINNKVIYTSGYSYVTNQNNGLHLKNYSDLILKIC